MTSLGVGRKEEVGGKRKYEIPLEYVSVPCFKSTPLPTPDTQPRGSQTAHTISSFGWPVNMYRSAIFATTCLLSLDGVSAFAPAPRLLVGTHTQHAGRIQPCHALSNDSSSNMNNLAPRMHKAIRSVGTAAVLFTTVLTSPINVHTDIQQHHFISIERSVANAITENQQFVADVWFAVTAQFFDQTFNGLGEDGWRAKEKEAMQAVAETGPDDDEKVTEAINKMLKNLDDP